MSLNEFAKRIHDIADSHGFWPKSGRNFGEMIALAHSELSEALESHRDNEPAVFLKHDPGCDAMEPRYRPSPCSCRPKPEGSAVELVDCIIRCLDTLSSLNVDIDEVMEMKMAYNEGRPFKHGRGY